MHGLYSMFRFYQQCVFFPLSIVLDSTFYSPDLSICNYAQPSLTAIDTLNTIILVNWSLVFPSFPFSLPLTCAGGGLN